MKDLVIVGSGGFAREVAWLIEENNKEQAEWNILGFVSEDLCEGADGYSVLGNDDWLLNTTKPISVVFGMFVN